MISAQWIRTHLQRLIQPEALLPETPLWTRALISARWMIRTSSPAAANQMSRVHTIPSRLIRAVPRITAHRQLMVQRQRLIQLPARLTTADQPQLKLRNLILLPCPTATYRRMTLRVLHLDPLDLVLISCRPMIALAAEHREATLRMWRV